ncbi:hypothetical protein Pcinc_033426 [Petrolisthes cinctipes]|uniref:Uncharacterized protein n=1 Tax=Petrolisthes cinctipes TaxID=88211 RepID=A0AAE1K1V7_PETCI|nr:hypothetical protein Pcinc_033426 [Petrolisthes cinctipes]
MSWKPECNLYNTTDNSRWDDALFESRHKRILSDEAYQDHIVPTAIKKVRTNVECKLGENGDAVIPEINTTSNNSNTQCNTNIQEEEETENCELYVRTKVPKSTSSSLQLQGLCPVKEYPNGTPEEEELGQDYIIEGSPRDINYNIEQKFLVEMPEDFFKLWKCCRSINKEKPEEALCKAGLTLVGPYDLLNGKLDKLKTSHVSSYVCHWRYYYDPPEFMTVIAGDRNEYHIGYYRDDPFQMPCFVASMSSLEPGIIKPLGENIFAGVCNYLTQQMRENPFKKEPYQRLYNCLEKYAKSLNYSLKTTTPGIKWRNRNIVAKGFHGAGIVAHRYYDDGCIDTPESRENLRKIFQMVVEAKSEDEQNKYFEEVRKLINNVQLSYDDSDYGPGVELGMNMLTYGSEVFHKSIFMLLGVAYDLMGKEPNVDILLAHLKNRRRGSNMSMLELVE